MMNIFIFHQVWLAYVMSIAELWLSKHEIESPDSPEKNDTLSLMLSDRNLAKYANCVVRHFVLWTLSVVHPNSNIWYLGNFWILTGVVAKVANQFVRLSSTFIRLNWIVLYLAQHPLASAFICQPQFCFISLSCPSSTMLTLAGKHAIRNTTSSLFTVQPSLTNLTFLPDTRLCWFDEISLSDLVVILFPWRQ